MTTLLTSLAVGITVAVVSACVTWRLALKRFRAEQWWSRKADAYAAIMEALHYSKDCDSQYLREIEDRRQLNAEYKAELFKKGQDADRQIRKALDMSTFLFCEEAVRVLEELRLGLADAGDATFYDEHLYASQSAVTKCIDQLPAIAKKDLGVK